MVLDGASLRVGLAGDGFGFVGFSVGFFFCDR